MVPPSRLGPVQLSASTVQPIRSSLHCGSFWLHFQRCRRLVVRPHVCFCQAVSDVIVGRSYALLATLLGRTEFP